MSKQPASPSSVGIRLRVSYVSFAGSFAEFLLNLAVLSVPSETARRSMAWGRDEDMGKRQYDGAVATFSPSPGGSIRENFCKRRAGEGEGEPTRLNHVCLSNIHHSGTWVHKSRKSG